MKTIFDKIDPKYIECASGTCEHVAHSNNAVLWTVIAILLVWLGMYSRQQG